MTYKYYVGLLVYVVISSLSISQLVHAVRPAYESDPGRCPFSNRLAINGQPAEMIEKSPGKKYFYRMNYSREVVTLDKLVSICRMYNLEGAEILDQDDYNEVIKIVKETGWSFWLAIRGKFAPEHGNYHFDFKFMDGSTPIGFHDFGPEGFDLSTTQTFEQSQEGCVAVIPNPANPSGVSWTKVACTDGYDILCQYKKPCYKRSDYVKDPTRPVKHLIPLLSPGGDESGYAISTIQATWPFARKVCEDADMSLLWFEEDSEVETFRNLTSRFATDHAGYDGKSFWTAGRFSPSPDIYSNLHWWQRDESQEVPSWDLSLALTGQPENSGGFTKLWGKEREATHLDQNEPYDEGLRETEKCVDATFSGDHAEYFTSKCGKSLRYFICKDWTVVKQSLDQGNSPKSSFMEYCAGDEYHKTREKDCAGEMIFAGQTKPECTCYSGVHGLMADNKCKPRLLVGTGCTKLKARSSLHWKILPGHITQNDKPWIIIVHRASNDEGDRQREMYNWLNVNVEDSGERQILGAAGATVYFSGFDGYWDLNALSSYEICFVRNEMTEGMRKEFYEFRVPQMSSSLKLRYYNYEEGDCGLDRIAPEELWLHQVANEKNDCQLGSCKAQKIESSTKPGSESTTESFPDDPSCEEIDDGEPTACENDNDAADEVRVVKYGSRIIIKGKAEGDIEDANDSINRQLLIKAIEMAFSGSIESTSVEPKNTWIILEKIFELAKQTCGQMVNGEFLSRVLKYFKIAHLGENYAYGGYFSEGEMKQISTFLDVCHHRIKASERMMEFQVEPCFGRGWRVTLENSTKEVISRSTDGTGYEAVFHHHVIEATWDVIDLWSAICLNEFKSSYLLYHHMEQGLEALFTDKLKKLWHFPSISDDYFQQLLGPDEGIQLMNLDQCVLAAYKGNLRQSRMKRPSRGRTTVVGQMIRNRLETEKLKSNGIPPTPTRNSTGASNGNVTTACIRGSVVRCYKPSKDKRRALFRG